jgi:hypothetical protein
MIEASVVGIRVRNEWSLDRYTTPYEEQAAGYRLQGAAKQPNSRTIEDNRSTMGAGFRLFNLLALVRRPSVDYLLGLC